MDEKSIKKNIAAFRKKSGMSQTQVAEVLGMSRTAYRNLERGHTRVVNENIGKMATVFETTLEEIVLGYRPLDGDGGRLEDARREYVTKRQELEAECEAKIADLRDQNKTLKEYVESLKELVRSKEEIIRSKEEVIEALRGYFTRQ